MLYKKSSGMKQMVMLTLWVCLQNHSTGKPLLASAKQTNEGDNVNLAEHFNQKRHIDPYLLVSETKSPEDLLNLDPSDRTLDSLSFSNNIDPHEIVTPEVWQNIDINHNKDTTDIFEKHKLNPESTKSPYVIAITSHEGPIVQTSENKSVVYILAHVLDMEKGLYYIPANSTNGSTEAWVFWKIPHLYNLTNPPDNQNIKLHTSNDNTTSEYNHSYYVLILGLGCFVCGLLVMLILTLVILTKRFSTKTRPRRPRERTTTLPRQLSQPYPENAFYSQRRQMPRRRYSNGDVTDILRNQFYLQIITHCECTKCKATVYEDDDVPLININDCNQNDLNLNDIISVSSNDAYPSTEINDYDLQSLRKGREMKHNRHYEVSTTRTGESKNNQDICACKSSEKQAVIPIRECSISGDSHQEPSKHANSKPWTELDGTQPDLGVGLLENCTGESPTTENLQLTALHSFDASVYISGAVATSASAYQSLPHPNTTANRKTRKDERADSRKTQYYLSHYVNDKQTANDKNVHTMPFCNNFTEMRGEENFIEL